MVVGLYDIDLLHAASAWPNLELMKVYNYFNQQGDSVILMKKKKKRMKDDIIRLSILKIIKI